jgi:TrmH family RNA methyltransferase
MAKAQTVTSAANPLVKDVRRAAARGGLTAEGLCLAETFHLLEEALRSDCEVPVVLAAESAATEAEGCLGRRRGIRLVVVPDALFADLAATETPQGVMALVKPPAWDVERLFAGPALVVVLDGVQDPGNAGAIVRAAEAFGATGVLFLKGTVSPYNPKMVRASAGSVFRVPLLNGLDARAAREAFAQHGAQLYAGVPVREGGRPVSEVDLSGPCGLVIGSEGRGVGAELRAAAVSTAIPTVGVESLNAAVAAGILLYEARRQRVPRP